MRIRTKDELVAQFDQLLVCLAESQGLCSQLYDPLKALLPRGVEASWDLEEIEEFVCHAVALLKSFSGRYLA